MKNHDLADFTESDSDYLKDGNNQQRKREIVSKMNEYNSRSISKEREQFESKTKLTKTEKKSFVFHNIKTKPK